jgi:hypothetical protein
MEKTDGEHSERKGIRWSEITDIGGTRGPNDEAVIRRAKNGVLADNGWKTALSENDPSPSGQACPIGRATPENGGGAVFPVATSNPFTALEL